MYSIQHGCEGVFMRASARMCVCVCCVGMCMCMCYAWVGVGVVLQEHTHTKHTVDYQGTGGRDLYMHSYIQGIIILL